MPIVGIPTAAVISPAKRAGMASRTMPKQPADSSSRASRSSPARAGDERP
jgi:hypothetical protein